MAYFFPSNCLPPSRDVSSLPPLQSVAGGQRNRISFVYDEWLLMFARERKAYAVAEGDDDDDDD